MDLRGAVRNNLKGLSEDDINGNILDAINNKKESALPGLGVLFEVYYNSLDDNAKRNVVSVLHKELMV